MKKIFYFLFVVCFASMGLTGCGDNKLDTPVVGYNNGTIVWESINNADKYEVYVNGNIYTTYENCFNLPIEEATKTFEIKVKSVSEELKDSDFSQLLFFSAKKINKVQAAEIKIDNCLNKYEIKWEETNCTNYNVYINNKEYETSECSLITDNSYYSTGINTIVIQPVGSEYDIIPIPTTLSVEKSQKLSNTNNVRIQNGEVVYGDNSKFDTSYLNGGEINGFTISNIEDGKINSDGPYVEFYKLLTPKITGSYRLGSNVIVEGTFNADCESIYVEILNWEMAPLNYGMIGGFGSTNTFKISISDSTSASHYVRVKACKNDCISSNYVYNSLAS